ncbi:MAG: cation:proton antiporter [Proteobacteria bacterium]|nr:cation:proton antiporter [Pseudomonadota bacterium]
MTELIASSLFYQLAAILILAGVCGAVAYVLRQPLIVAFIAAGLLAGPDMLRIVAADDHTMETLANLGIALLLFMVGLKLDLSLIAKLGKTAVLAGMLQIVITLALGGAICLMLGFGFVESLLTGTALALSSTIIVVKLLSDRRAIDSLYGQISIGILIIQDIFVILVTVVIGAMASAGNNGFNASELGLILLKVAALAATAAFFIRFAAQPLSRVLARSPELMVIFAIGFAGMAAALCEYIGLSREMGGLVAGITLATTPLNNVLAARLMGLRDFLLLFFFVSLGAHMDLQGMARQIFPALIMSGFVLGVKPVIVMAIMRATGYRRRTGFMAGVTLSQISEFSMILMAMAAGVGIVGADSVSMITLVALVTIGLSTYAIIHSERLCDFLDGRTAFFEKASSGGAEVEIERKEKRYDVIVFGMGRYGAAMAREFQKRGLSVLGVDFNPEAIRHAQAMGIPALYGDAADPEFPAHLPLSGAQAVVFAFHHYITGPLTTDLRRTLAHSLRGHGYKGHIAATSHLAHHDHDLSRLGIDIVLMPFDDAARHAAEKIVDVIGAQRTEGSSAGGC